jgi:formate hydrogenlyase transcriptional activator
MAEETQPVEAQAAPPAEGARRSVGEAERARILLEVTGAVVSNLTLRDLLIAVSSCLKQFFKHDFASIVLYDEESGRLRVHALDAPAPGGALDEGMSLPLEGTPPGLAIKTRRTVMRERIDLEEFHAPQTRMAYAAGLRSGCSVPLISRDRVLGTINVGSLRESAFTNEDAELLRRVAEPVAIAVENTLNYERATRERARAQALLQVNNAIATNLNVRDLLRAASGSLHEYFRHDFAALALYDEKTGTLHVHAFDRARPDTDIYEGEPVPIEGTLSGLAFSTRRALYRSPINVEETHAPMARRFFEQQALQSFCCAPLVSRGRALGVITIGSRQRDAMTAEDVELFARIASQLALAVENAVQYSQIEGLKNKLASEKLYLEEEIKAEYNFAEIVGRSRALKVVLEQLKTVAPTDSVVLVCGETGTGKELIARAVHDLSARRERTMVKVNCAAIPTGLLESEFFGHEKGAFTGAVSQRAGRFELANKGTLFLDEVGEIPLELQPKLLRVLQEQEFERLGGSRTIKVDVRLIAATNCNLREMVAEKKFRSDLFYRLNVFPVFLPPLRERAEDIPLLAGYFAQKHSRRMNKRIDAIPSETIEALCRYRWPGNVRELENFVERACILTRGRELQAPLSELESPAGESASPTAPASSTSTELLSLADAERAHIEDVLRHTKGVVGGKGGAAEVLGLPISTLRGRMKKLGLL